MKKSVAMVLFVVFVSLGVHQLANGAETKGRRCLCLR